MVIVVWNRYVDMSSNLDETDWIWHSINTFQKGINGNVVGQTRYFSLGTLAWVWQPILEKESFEFKPFKIHLKLTLRHTLFLQSGW